MDLFSSSFLSDLIWFGVLVSMATYSKFRLDPMKFRPTCPYPAACSTCPTCDSLMYSAVSYAPWNVYCSILSAVDDLEAACPDVTREPVTEAVGDVSALIFLAGVSISGGVIGVLLGLTKAGGSAPTGLLTMDGNDLSLADPFGGDFGVDGSM
jgi:hypothetical protein